MVVTKGDLIVGIVVQLDWKEWICGWWYVPGAQVAEGVEIGDVDDEAVALVVYHRLYFVHVHAPPHLNYLQIHPSSKFITHKKIKLKEDRKSVV